MSKDHNSNIVGKVLYEYRTLQSTNDKALSLIKNRSIQEGTVISAYHQIQGRGQMGTSWHSRPGENITLSVILKPQFLDISDQFYLNKAVCVALQRFLSSVILGAQVKIKWPNDIYVGDRKIAGVLIQNVLQGHIFQWAVIGIGLNVHQTEFENSIVNPTSLTLATSQRFDLEELKKRLFQELETCYRVLKESMEDLDSIYQASLYRINEDIEFYLPSQISFRGRIVGVEKSGALRVLESNGTQHRFRIKEIRY